MKFEAFESEKDLDERQDLFLKSFPELRGSPNETLEFYQWKYKSFPARPTAYEFIARENKILGYYAALPYPYQIGGHKFLCGMVCDVMTHPEARGKGVFTKLGKYSLEQLKNEGVDFVTGYPIRKEVLPGHLKVGWKVAFRLPMYIKFIYPRKILFERKLGFLAPALKGAFAFQRTLLKLLFKPPSQYTVREESLQEFLQDNSFQEFFEKFKVAVPNHLIKNSDFYRWRLRAPGSQYQIISIFEGPKMIGISITRVTEIQGLRCLALLDIMTLAPCSQLARTLFSRLDEIAISQRVEAIVSMMSPTTARKYRIFQNGFLLSPFHFKLIINSLNNKLDPNALSDPELWHLTWIDSDDL